MPSHQLMPLQLPDPRRLLRREGSPRPIRAPLPPAPLLHAPFSCPPYNAPRTPYTAFSFCPSFLPAQHFRAPLRVLCASPRRHIREGSLRNWRVTAKKSGKFSKKFQKILKKFPEKNFAKVAKVAKVARVAKVAKAKTPPKVDGRRKLLGTMTAHNAPKTLCKPLNRCGWYLSCLRIQPPLCPAYTSPGVAWA